MTHDWFSNYFSANKDDNALFLFETLNNNNNKEEISNEKEEPKAKKKAVCWKKDSSVHHVINIKHMMSLYLQEVFKTKRN